MFISVSFITSTFSSTERYPKAFPQSKAGIDFCILSTLAFL